LINEEEYTKAIDNSSEFIAFFAHRECPGCHNLHGWTRHAWYYKYHGEHRIIIIRFRCRACCGTHAVIPSFSIPHTCLDTETTELYISQRYLGKTRRAAAQEGCFKDRSHDFLRSLEKRFATAVVRAKALFSCWGNGHAQGYGWIQSTSEDQKHVISFLNMNVLDLAGCAFFGGKLLDNNRYINAGMPVSHENSTYPPDVKVIDSG